jgi:hypothetical protein
MKLLAYLRSFLSTLFNRNREDRDLDEEFQSHIQAHADHLERSGLPRAEAERRARIAFGGYQRAKEECREQRAGLWLEIFWRDVRFGLRMLAKIPVLPPWPSSPWPSPSVQMPWSSVC